MVRDSYCTVLLRRFERRNTRAIASTRRNTLTIRRRSDCRWRGFSGDLKNRKPASGDMASVVGAIRSTVVTRGIYEGHRRFANLFETEAGQSLQCNRQPWVVFRNLSCKTKLFYWDGRRVRCSRECTISRCRIELPNRWVTSRRHSEKERPGNRSDGEVC